ncbi:yjeF-like protein, hydroxyethylthiazole kinase-related [Xenococcus sp. PCC 7305]|uniref:bifunctional ADP-dependent NAD(P)H-hydrate dehydratase/NAD(P)H-hydrate epimerase n=1 Tax=Xenococcus sp. PCC 7305 TaxID=102125 RepID=UPI0002AC1206|nr:bifunctional ADP-dependent NAD(P)H-hydrate dehydratase/NAD(P)H-hydrate epimerase [Xenococcus sp. PCC 7305]ELS04774.1 yjeF-like protein, hydroxyethylthiazole kinase-related [Xenococcus sp. PCC 7305]
MNINSSNAIVTTEQMRAIEERIFGAGMPIPALMEKAAGLCFHQIQKLYPREKYPQVGIVVGPGHNGGDALVIARELYFAGYTIRIYCGLIKVKELTASHSKYAHSLGIPFYEEIDALGQCDLIIDGLFGFGLSRSISGKIAEAVARLNSWPQPIVSIDLPSGIHTDTGAVLGIAIKATHTLCLGLWKRAFFQDQALEYIGQAIKLDFGIPSADIKAIISPHEAIQTITQTLVRDFLPLPRPIVTHKYRQGHLLLICGSERYAGAAILTALGARASGVGMLSIAVPKSLKPLLVSKLPEALVIGCEETDSGAIASLPFSDTDFKRFDAIACGPGLTSDAAAIVKKILTVKSPLVLDADGLTLLTKFWISRKDPNKGFGENELRILTPHEGEFKRLFPDVNLENSGLAQGEALSDRLEAVRQASKQSNAIVLLKGARTAIANPQGQIWTIPQSTPALARGGSGDVLTGLIGGLIVQLHPSNQQDFSEQLFNLVATAAWLHAQAAILASEERTELGVDGVTLSQYILPLLHIIK